MIYLLNILLLLSLNDFTGNSSDPIKVIVIKTETKQIIASNENKTLVIFNDINELTSPNINIHNVVKPCVLSENEPVENNSSAIAPCKGEYRHCGDGVFKCVQVSYGLFACCYMPDKCPIFE